MSRCHGAPLSRVHSATDQWLLFTPGPGHRPAHTDPEHSALGYTQRLRPEIRQIISHKSLLISLYIKKVDDWQTADVFDYFEKPSSR